MHPSFFDVGADKIRPHLSLFNIQTAITRRIAASPRTTPDHCRDDVFAINFDTPVLDRNPHITVNITACKNGDFACETRAMSGLIRPRMVSVGGNAVLLYEVFQCRGLELSLFWIAPLRHRNICSGSAPCSD